MAWRRDAASRARKRIAVAARSGATELDLSGLGLKEMPSEIGQLTSLTALNASNNELSVLPREIGELVALTELVVWGNPLSALSPEIGQLTALTTLDASLNRLSALPPEIRQLTALTTLDVRHNQLSALPQEIWQLARLTTLNVSNNQLSALPPEIGQLTALRALYVSDNQLSTLPAEIGQLMALRALYVSGNQLLALPPEIGQLVELRSLDVSHNPLPEVLREAAQRGMSELLAYLRKLATQGAKHYEAKLVFVGAGGVGKTCLRDALEGRTPKEDQPTTDALEIGREPLRLDHPASPGTRMTLNCWDFGGQEVYEITHQFFFSPRTIYLVLWAPRLGARLCDVDGWINLIKLRVGDTARILVVTTHVRTDRHPKDDVQLDRLQERFGSIVVGLDEVDTFQPSDDGSAAPYGVAKLKSHIAALAAELPETFPKTWHAARQDILGLARAPTGPQRAWMKFEEFAGIVAKRELCLEDARRLALMMDAQGHIIYHGWADDSGTADDQVLHNVLILQPEWLAKAIGRVLEDPQTRAQSGVATHQRLAQIWTDANVQPPFEPALHPYFVRLMERFELSYRLSPEMTLVPQLIQGKRPEDLPWFPDMPVDRGSAQLPLTISLHEIPRGLVPITIASLQRYKDRREWHWRSGTYLRYRDYGDAIIELNDEQRELLIWVRGAWPAHFLSVLVNDVEEMLGRHWPRLRKDTPDGYFLAVPCYETAAGKPCPGRFDLATLRLDQHDGLRTRRCDRCRQPLELSKLLLGFSTPESELSFQLARLDERTERMERTLETGLAQLIDELWQVKALSIAQLSRLAQVYRGLLRALDSERRDGPCMFSLVQAGGTPTERQYNLTLWCEYPDGPHPCRDPRTGKLLEYSFRRTRAWLVKAAPWITWSVRLMKVAIPVAGTMIKNAADELGLSGLKPQIDLMEKAVGALPTGDLETGMAQRAEEYDYYHATGSALREMHKLLAELDPNAKWRDVLRRTDPTRGDFLWLCPEHFSLYELPLPTGFELPGP